MSNYTKSTNFATKDNLTPGDPLKVVRGTEIDTEFNNIATAVATKTDNSAAAITGGTIDGATVGATTPATGSFTTLAASGTTTLAGALVGAVTQAAFNTVSTTLNLGGAATAVNLGAATGTATVNNTTLAAKAITASTTLAVTGTSTLTGAVTATAGVSGPITSSSVSITGGSITGITDLAVADGGTGASTAAGGLNNLLPSQTGNASKYLQTDGTNASWDAVSLSTADITGTLGVANGGTGVTTSTGTTNVVLSNSPTLVTPTLGVATATSLQGIIGNVTPAAGSFTTLGASSTATLNTLASSGATLTGGTVNGMTVGATTASTGAFTTLSASSTATLSGLTASTALALDASKNIVSVTNTGTGSNVLATSPTLVTPVLGVATGTSFQGIIGNVTPAAANFTTLGASSTATLNTLASSGATLTGGTINGMTVGATTATTGAFTSLTASTTLGVTGVSTLTGGAQVTGSISGYGGGEVRLGPTTSAAASAISTQATGAPTLDFAHRGTSNTGTFNWLNGTGASSLLMTLTSTGLGIGTSSPVAKVQGTRDGAPASSGNLVAPILASASDGGQGLAIGASTGDYTWIQSAFTNNASASAASLRFYMGATERVRIDSAGTFRVKGAGTAGSTDTVQFSGTAPASSLLLDASGNLGINTTSPARKIDVAGTTLSANQINGLRLNNVGVTANNYFDVLLGIDGVGNPYGSLQTGNQANSYITFLTGSGPTERMRLPAAGGIQSVNSISVGNATPTTSGAGITFPATQSASSDANTLDDYEEGTWTPVVADASSGGNTGTYTNVKSIYTKIGRQVTVNAYLSAIVTTGMTAGNTLFIRGLPFTSADFSQGNFYTYRVGRNASTVSSSVAISSGATYLQFQLYTTNSATTDLYVLVSNVVSGTSEIMISISYTV